MTLCITNREREPLQRVEEFAAIKGRPTCRASTKFEINLKTAKALGLTVIE